MDSIKYDIGENDDDDFFIEIFEVLRQYLPVDSQLSRDDALEQIARILPERTPGAPQSGTFYSVALVMAGQTPYNHPSLEKLASIVVAMVETYDSKDCYNAELGRPEPTRWYYTVVGDQSAPPDAKEYVNEQALISRTAAAIDKVDEISETYFYPFLRAFEEDDPNKEAETMAAALWILNDGFHIYEASFYPEHDLRDGFWCGPKYQKLLDASSKRGFKASLKRLRTAVVCTSSDASEHEPKQRSLTPHRWSFWKQGFLDAATDDSEVSKLAGEAARKMDELEARSATTSRSSLVKESKDIEEVKA